MNAKHSLLFRPMVMAAILLASTHLSSKAQSWDTVGQACFSAGKTNVSRMALDKNGTPYVAYVDSAYGDSITVMKYDGNNWVTVGAPGFSVGSATSLSFAIDYAGTPYVAYTDHDNGDKAMVMKYNGNDWAVLGTPDFSPNEALDLSLAISKDGILYVAYTDAPFNLYPLGIWRGPVTVMKYDGTDWVNVGTARLSPGPANQPSITIDVSGIPYVTFVDSANNAKITTMKYDHGGWMVVGDAGFAAAIPKSALSTATDASGVPYVAFSSKVSPYRATVMKYNSGNWVNVGGDASADQTRYASVAIDNDGAPYVAYQDWSENHFRVTVKKYDGTNWGSVGNTSFSSDTAQSVNLAVDKTGIPYVSYIDARPVGGTLKTTVMRFKNSLSVKDINGLAKNMSITPNPSQGLFAVNIPATNRDNAEVTVTDATGKVVKHLTIPTNKDTTIHMDGAPTGVYLITATAGGNRWSGKLVVTP